MIELKIQPTNVVVVTDEGEELDLPRNPNESCEETARKIERVIQVDSVQCEELGPGSRTRTDPRRQC